MSEILNYAEELPMYRETLHTVDGKALLEMDLPELKMNI